LTDTRVVCYICDVADISTIVDVPKWDLGDRLVKARKVAGVKQSDMAEYLGLSRAALSGFENGDVVPRLGYLRLWADRCKVPLAWLRYGDSGPTPTPDGTADLPERGSW
jgi:transcriptional regulator with XRE-family HTH domain